MTALAMADLPAGREAPPEIARGLKDVDPTAELVYIGDGRWDLLRLRPKTDARMRSAALMLANAYQQCERGWMAEAGWYRALRFARLLRLGYVVFNRYRLPHDPDWRIVAEFRRALWEYTHDANDRLIESRWNARERKADAIRAEFADHARAAEAARALRNPVTFTMPGLKETA